MTTVRIEGLRGVIATLKGLPRELKAGRVIRTAVRKGAAPIALQAKENVRRIVMEPNEGGLPTGSTGALEAAISVKRIDVEGGKNGEAVSVKVGKITQRTSTGLGRPRGDPRFYAWWLELGTERMRPHPFMRPAYEVRKVEALSVTVREILAGLARVLKKLQVKNKVRT